MAMREIKKRTSPSGEYIQDLRGLGDNLTAIGPFAVLTIRGLSHGAQLHAAAEFFSCKLHQALDNDDIEVTTYLTEGGTHKKQIISLWGLALYLNANHPSISMNLSTSRLDRDDDVELSFTDRLCLNDEAEAALIQSGLHLTKHAFSSEELALFATGRLSLSQQNETPIPRGVARHG